MKSRNIRIILFLTGLILIIALVAIIAALGLSWVYYLTISWLLIVAVLLWVGNSFISKKLDKSYPWLEYGNMRLLVQFLSTMIYSLAIINASYFLIKGIFTEDPPVITQIIVMNVYGIFIILPVVSIYFGIHFLRSWRKSEIDAEMFQKESMRSQLEALKNHLDPHFLFNNLNILSSLIDKDKELSKEYLEKFAEVYRVILQSNVTEPVPLSQELTFLDAYIYLIKIRFEENIQISINVDKNHHNYVLPPLTLQMLVENAIKHNMVTESKPLQIKVESNHDHYLIIRNNLEPRKIPYRGSGSGLKNIQARYQYFTDLPLVKEETESEFIVKVPLIELEEL